MERIEVDAIDQAFSDALVTSFKVMSLAFIAAKGSAAEERKAEQAFKAGVAAARRARERALALLE